MAEEIVYRIESPLGAALPLNSLRFHEALDLPYVAHVDVMVEEPDPDPEPVLGADAVVEIVFHGRTRRIAGIIRTARGTSKQTDDAFVGSMYMEIVPALWMLSLRRNTRMFQEKTAPEILETVLGEGLGPYGRSVTNELKATYPAREYCLQYQETDLEFVERLMREEGISYSFDHAGAVEQMILRDSNKSYATAVDVPVHFSAIESTVDVGVESIRQFERAHASTVTKVTVREWDWTKSDYLVKDEEGDADDLGKTRESYEHGWGKSIRLYEYGNPKYGKNDIARQKALRLEAHREPGLTGQGVGRVVAFAPGTTFELSGHPTPGHDGEYLITRVIHESSGTERYTNRFDCIPLDVEHRPHTIPVRKPRIPGIQTAVVTGPAGEEIHTDEHGRIKVQFHWDRENPADETSSCWVRVQQKWAGKGWGFWWLPRIGMEVVVQFIDGDPDRPLVTGCVYDSNNNTPYPLPGEKTKSTIKSNSSPGGGGSNELRFEDKAGSEEIYTHAQKDYNEVVEHDHTTLVHNNQTIEVDNNQTQTIHNNQTERVDGNQDLSVGGNRTVHIEANFDEKVDGTETRKVTGAVDETFNANETRTVASSLTETFSSSETRDIGGSQTETIAAARSVTITGSSTVDISGALTQTIVGGITMTTPKLEQTVSGAVTVLIGGSLKITAAGGMFYGAPAGIQMVDSFQKAVGQTIGSEGVIMRVVTGVKTEKYGANIALVGQSKQFSGSEIVLGPQLQLAGSVIKMMAARLCPGALKAAQGPSSDD